MKKLLIAIIVLIIVSTALGALLWFGLQPASTTLAGEDGRRTTRLERWIGDRLQAIAQANLNPDFSFDSLDYEYPATVELRNVVMADGDVEIINVPAVAIEFTEVPKVGKPIIIEKIAVVQPTMRLVTDAEGNLRGWSNLVRTAPDAEQTEPAIDEGRSTRPSDVFAIRLIEVSSASVSYEPTDEPAMKLDELTFDLTTDPDVDAPGWYDLNVEFNRDHLMVLNIDGRFSIDEAIMELASLSLDMDVQPQRYEMMPPSLQKILKRYAVTGTLELNADGTVHATEPMASQINLVASLVDGYLSVDDYTIPVKAMDIDASLSESVLDLTWLVADAMGGTSTITGRAVFDDARNATVEAELKQLRLERFLRPAEAEFAPQSVQDAPVGVIGDEAQTPLQEAAERADAPEAKNKPQYVGNIDLTLQAAMNLDQPQETLDGTGAIEVTQARLVNIPLFGGLVRTVAGAINPSGGADDKLNANLEFRPTQVLVRDMKLISQTVAARGEGEINYDGAINFRFNAGPMEKMQESLGALGELLGKITDSLVKYQVTGTFAEPKFDTRALGIGATSSEQPKADDAPPADAAPDDAPASDQDDADAPPADNTAAEDPDPSDEPDDAPDRPNRP